MTTLPVLVTNMLEGLMSRCSLPVLCSALSPSASKGIAEELLEMSKCNDFVVNRGHYFGTSYLDKKENEPGPKFNPDKTVKDYSARASYF
jgi:hypothetical protein